MRTTLAAYLQRRQTYTATVVMFGSKPGRRKTILLADVRCENIIVADHLWLGYSKAFAPAEPLQPGDVIEFTAQVRTYLKGYCGRKLQKWEDRPARVVDYTLHRLSRVRKRDMIFEETIDIEKLHQSLQRWQALPNARFHVTGTLGKLQIDFSGTGKECAEYVQAMSEAHHEKG